MSDSDEYRERVAKQRRKEMAEFENSPTAKYQAQIDWWWENEIRRREIERARARSGEDPESGEYNPIRRFEEEQADAEDRAGREFWRGQA
jgi:hypothetical protein